MLPSVCVIGAGSSGIAAAKALHERGFAFDCFEASDRVGGNWVFRNRNGMSSAYRSLHINTSRERMEFADFPMPKSYPDFPHHTHIAAYFDAYVDHFGFRDRITFETRVTRAERLADGTWDGHDRHGRHARATTRSSWPTATTGTRAGPSRPSRATSASPGASCTRTSTPARTPGCSATADVVVLGMGNSAMDIAVESSFSAAAHLPRRAPRRLGDAEVRVRAAARPFPVSPRIPVTLRRRAQEAIAARCGRRHASATGCPSPTTASARPTRRCPTTCSSRLAHGEITPKPNIAALSEHRVRFTDGSEVAADVVIYCTGYKVTFPFFDPALIAAPGNDLPLFRRVFHPDIAERVLRRAAAAARRGDAARRAAVGSGSATTWPAATRCRRRRRRCARTSRPSAPPCSAATWPRSGTRCRSTSRTTCSALAAERRARRAARRAPGTGCRCRGARGRGAGGVTAGRDGQAGADQGGEPGGDRRSRARRLRRAGLRGGGRARRRSAAPGSPRARSTTTSRTRPAVFRAVVEDDRRRGAAARARRPHGRATASPAFVEEGYRAYFAFIVEDPATFAFLRRNLATLRALGADAVLPLGIAELAEDLRAAIARRRRLDVDYCSHAMVAVGVELGARLMERDPPDVAGATRFATGPLPAGSPRAVGSPRCDGSGSTHGGRPAARRAPPGLRRAARRSWSCSPRRWRRPSRRSACCGSMARAAWARRRCSTRSPAVGARRGARCRCGSTCAGSSRRRRRSRRRWRARSACAGVRRSTAPAGRLVLLLDTFEQAVGAGGLAARASSCRAAGRRARRGRRAAAPGEGWRRDPGWRELLRVVSLRNLVPDEARELLRAPGVAEELHERVLELTHGHPLALWLLVEVFAQRGEEGRPALELGAVPDVRRALLAGFVAGRSELAPPAGAGGGGAGALHDRGADARRAGRR